MEGEEERSEDSRSFSKASIPRRIAIVVAGATVNIIFAVVIYFIISATSGTYISNEINSTINGYAAQSIDLKNGDKNIKIERENNTLDFTIKPTEVKTKVTGIYLDENCKIAAVEKGSSSEKQGIKSNDKLIKINNKEINGDRNKALELIGEKGVNTMLVTVERKGKEINIELTPDYVSSYYLGVNLKQAPDTFINRCIGAKIQTKEFVFSIVDNLKKLFTGNVGIDQMMGPVGISEVVAKTNGFQEFISMMALISLSLGVTNLLPIPALDGGKIFILIIEAIRRKPMKQETEINIQLLGFSILIALSLYVTYNDILRIF